MYSTLIFESFLIHIMAHNYMMVENMITNYGSVKLFLFLAIVIVVIENVKRSFLLCFVLS